MVEPTAIAGAIAVVIIGCNAILTNSTRKIGSNRLNSADVPAASKLEVAALQTIWGILTELLQGTGRQLQPLVWNTTSREQVFEVWVQIEALSDHWDHLIEVTKGSAGTTQAQFAIKHSLYQLHWCFRMMLQTFDGLFTSGLLQSCAKVEVPQGMGEEFKGLIKAAMQGQTIPTRIKADGPSVALPNCNNELYLRLAKAREWLDKHYPVVRTTEPLFIKSLSWNHEWAGLRASGKAIAILHPGSADAEPVTYGAGPREQGYALIKYQQPGLPEVLSAPPLPFLQSGWWPNWTKRTKRSDFARWDLWGIKPAFKDDIPVVKVPANMQLRKGDAIKLANMHAPHAGRVMAREFHMMLPKLVLSQDKAYDHETTAFVVDVHGY